MKKLIDQLDRIFSQYIRLRDSKDGYCACITCGAVHDWKLMHAGHFIGRQHMATRWNEENVNAQCVKCNTFNEGEKYRYGLALQKKYKKDTPDVLEWKSRGLYKPLAIEMEEMIKHYENEVLKFRTNSKYAKNLQQKTTDSRQRKAQRL